MVDPDIQSMLDQIASEGTKDPPNTRFDGDQIVKPTFEIVHLGRQSGIDFQSSGLVITLKVNGTASRGIVINSDGTLGNLVQVQNTMTADGEKWFINKNVEMVALKNAYFTGNVQVGSLTSDIPTFSGSAIGLTNLSTAVFTGTSTNGIAIVSTDNRLRYVDQAGSVWRLPDGNPLPELHDLKAWNFDPTNATGMATMDEGRLYFFKILFHRSTQPTSIRFHVLNVANSPDPSYFGIYDLAGNRLCQTANIASLTTTLGTKTATLVSPPVMAPNYYYIAALFGAGPGSGPALATSGVPGSIANANLSGSSLRFAEDSSTASTTLPATYALSNLLPTEKTLWVGTA